MGDVNVQIVREFFELNLFQVLTNWQQSARRLRLGELGGQLFVQNISPASLRELPFLLLPADIAGIERAVVEVRAWHGDRFYPSVIEANPVLRQFVSDEAMALASDVFHHEPFDTILVVSELPASSELRKRSLSLLEDSGIGHVMEFPLVLKDLLDKVDTSGNYPSSQTLQLLRLLKRYKLVRNQQMEFVFAAEPPVADQPANVETDDFPDEQE